MANCRIGKITLKGGSEVHILNTPQNTENAILRDARFISSQFDEIDGYFLMCWTKDALHSMAFDIHSEGVISKSIAPAFVNDVFTKKITKNEAIDEIENG